MPGRGTCSALPTHAGYTVTPWATAPAVPPQENRAAVTPQGNTSALGTGGLAGDHRIHPHPGYAAWGRLAGRGCRGMGAVLGAAFPPPPPPPALPADHAVLP